MGLESMMIKRDLIEAHRETYSQAERVRAKKEHSELDYEIKRVINS